MFLTRWRQRLLLKLRTCRLLFVTVCVCVSSIYYLWVCLQSTADKSRGALDPSTLVKRSRLISLNLTTQQRNFRATNDVSFIVHDLDSHVFRSPFIAEDKDQETSAALVNRSTSADGNTRTFAVVWPCKGNNSNCFTDTRYPVEKCRNSRCRQTWSLTKADVVVFYVYRIKHNEGVPKFKRPSHQRWVMLTPEAPARGTEFAMLDFPALKGQFNWTQSYRLDSDIPTLYGLLKRGGVPRKNYDEIYRGKNVTAAWFVSNCDTPSLRQHYVQRMQKVADIHVYGSCGNYSCGNNSLQKRVLDKEECLPLLTTSYFFYLAFENSLCRDYVTEKFFKIFGDTDVIPVVRGGADYKRFFPRDTFLDASDFRSPEDLALFLVALAKDRDRYVRMLKEKSRYRLWPRQSWFCHLCDKMYQGDDDKKSYFDLRKWYLQSQCHEPNDM